MTLISHDEITDKIKSSALLVSLHLGRYNPIKTDRSESNKVLNSHHITNEKILKVKKHTLPTAEVIERIEKKDNQIRATVDKFTAPFSRGTGLLPAVKYLDLTTAIRLLFDDRDRLIKQLAADYNLYLEGAQRELNGAFDPKDYPPVASVVSRFSHKLSVFPIADPRDTKLNLLGNIADEIQQAVNETFKERTASLAPFIREVLLDPLVKASESLQNPDALFKDTLVSNILEAADRAEGLNILEDEQITNAVFGIRSHFQTLDPDSLRETPATRKEAVLATNNLIESLDGTVPPPKVVAPRKPRAKKSQAVTLQPCDPAPQQSATPEPEPLPTEILDPQSNHPVAVAPEELPSDDQIDDLADGGADSLLDKLGW